MIGASVDRVNVGSKLVGQAGTTMDEVVESVKRVTDIIAEISAASAEQSSDIEQINQAFTQIDEATNQNAALIEEAAAAAERMREEAAMLSRAVSIFRVDAVARARTEFDVTPAAPPEPAPVALAKKRVPQLS